MVSMQDIQAFADEIAREFRAQRIILFGSYAYGTPNEDSDVDLLIEMPYRGDAVDHAIEIRRRLHPGYPIDLIVRSPAEVRRRMAMNDWFIREIVEKGKVLHEARDGRMDGKSRRRLARGRRPVSRP